MKEKEVNAPDVLCYIFSHIGVHGGIMVNSASNRNVYQVYFLGVKAAGM